MTPAWIIFHLRVGPTKLALTRMVEPGTSTSVPLSWVRPDLQRPLKSHPRLGRRSGVLCRGDGLLTPPIWHRNWLNLVRLVGAVAIRNVFLWRPYEPAPHKLFRPGIVSPSATREGSTTDRLGGKRKRTCERVVTCASPSFFLQRLQGFQDYSAVAGRQVC